MEYRAIYDEQRNPTGKTRAKGEPLLPGEFIIAVGIWIFNGDKQILLIQRDPAKRFAPLKWDAPAGHAMAGETSVAAAVRELKEETGVSATEEELIFIGSALAPPYHGDNFCLYRDLSADEIILQEGETCAAKWVTYDEMMHMVEIGEISPAMIQHHRQIQPQFIELLHQAGAK